MLYLLLLGITSMYAFFKRLPAVCEYTLQLKSCSMYEIQ